MHAPPRGHTGVAPHSSRRRPTVGDANYSVVFPFWDMVFGTYADPLRVAVGGAGIQDDPIPRRFAEELTSPLTYTALVARRQQAPSCMTLHVSHGVARHIWRRRGVFPLRCKAHCLQRRGPLRGLLVPMATIFTCYTLL
jgi:hypothetical protein